MTGASAGFDPQAFLSQTFEETPDTKYVEAPEGEWDAHVDSVGEPRMTQNGSVLIRIRWAIDDPQAYEQVGLSQADNTLTVNQSLFIDLEGGRIATGPNKNVALGRLLDALDLAGQPWSFNDFVGRSARIAVRKRVNDEGTEFTEVTRVYKKTDNPF